MLRTTQDQGRADVADVRATNLAVVLRCVRERAPCSRADIAAATGLNKTTVSSLVSELLDRRLLLETGTTGNRVGRPAVMLTLDGSFYAAIGVEVNADHLTAVAVDLAGQPLLSWRRAFSGAASPHRAVTAVTALTRRIMTHIGMEGRQVLGLAIAVPAMVDGSGRVAEAPGLGWRGVDLAAGLSRALEAAGLGDVWVEIGNDANFAVLAEQRFGGHAEHGERQVTDIVYLTGETDLGAGIIMDGSLRRGNAGYSGELGHIQVDPAGPPCRCGRNGCLEAMAGITAVVRRASADLPAGTPVRSHAEMEVEIDEVVARARAGSPPTLRALEAAGGDLGAGVAILVNLLNPGLVVLGGHYVPLLPWLLPAVERELHARTVAPSRGGCAVVGSTLRRDAAALGAAARVLDAVESGRMPRDTLQRDTTAPSRAPTTQPAR